MSELSVFNEIVSHQLQGVMLHDDLCNMFDFMGLHGFKRCQEYHALEEFCSFRGTCRYMINHLNYMPSGISQSRAKDIIPSPWRSAARFEVSESDRKSKTKELFTKWHDWEKETKTFYERKFKELTDNGYIASANKVNCLICAVDEELKQLERSYIEYSSVNWDSVFLAEIQDSLHKEYERRTSENLKIEFC